MYFGSIKNHLKADFKELPESKDKQELLKIKRLRKILEYLERRKTKKMINQVFTIGQKYKYMYSDKKYLFDGRRMLALKKDGTPAQQGHVWINMYYYNRFEKI